MEKDVNKKKNNEDKKQEVIKEELKNKIDVNKKKKRRSRRKSKSKASLKKKNSKNAKNDLKRSKVLGFFVILFGILGFVLLLLILNVLINFDVVNKKIDKVTKLKDDVALIEKSYDNILKLNEEKKKLDLSNNDYNGKIVNIKKDIENINIKINKLKASK